MIKTSFYLNLFNLVAKEYSSLAIAAAAQYKTYAVHPETVAEQFWYLHQHKQETVSLCGEAIQAA